MYMDLGARPYPMAATVKRSIRVMNIVFLPTRSVSHPPTTLPVTPPNCTEATAKLNKNEDIHGNADLNNVVANEKAVKS
jgi:hypothetical protein